MKNLRVNTSFVSIIYTWRIVLTLFEKIKFIGKSGVFRQENRNNFDQILISRVASFQTLSAKAEVYS